MKGSWGTVWDIAGRRHCTNQGEGHLSEHAHEVLQAFVMQETQEAISAAMGNLIWMRS